MATITGATNEKVYSIGKWLGLNESPDGDTHLKMGEASKMVNFKITRDGNLKRRPGQMFFAGLNEEYEVHQSDDVLKIKEFNSGDDRVNFYSSVTAMAPPGTITMIGVEGVVERGKYKIGDAVVEDGVLSGTNDLEFVVQNGIVMVDGANNSVTLTELADILDDLAAGSYIYTEVDEMPYALRNDSLVYDGEKYVLNGYLLTAVVDGSTAKPVVGLWSGIVAGKPRLLAACDGKLYSLYDPDTDTVTRLAIGSLNTGKSVNFIPFSNKVYILNGYEYYEWDGTNFTTVTGYIPCVAIAIGPTGTEDAGELTGEYVNLLIPKRRVWLSPNGTGDTFQLPEKGLKSIDYVKDLATGDNLDSGWSGNTTNGTVTFSSAPAQAVNAYEVGYTAKSHSDDSDIPDYRGQVTANLYSELYSGMTDTRVFIYGDGSNKTRYSGMDSNGQPRADYFPDQYEAMIGDTNTPITAMIRHYSALMCYKTDSAWSISWTEVELANGDLTPGLYITPVNRDKGNVAPGQVRLVNNSPVTCSGSELYTWSSVSRYSSGISRDERNAKRISDRVQSSVKDLDFKECCMWDDDDGQEFYISGNGVTLVWNYVTDSWYRYDGLDAVIMCNFQGDVIVGTSDGKVMRLTYEKDTDDGRPIKAIWESGAMDFGASNMRKYSSMMWISLKPVAGSSVDVCVVTDRKNTFKDKIASADKAKVQGEPFPIRSKIKAKKFTYYTLQLSVNKKMPAVTITNVDFRVRQTGYSK